MKPARFLTRRQLVRRLTVVAAGLVPLLLRPAGVAADGRPGAVTDDWPFPTPGSSILAARLARHPRALQVDPEGGLAGLFGIQLSEARWVLYPVSRARGLPSDYEPSDLVYDLGHPLRALVVSDFRAMFRAAEQDQVYPTVVSGYRSVAYQTAVFERAVEHQLWQQAGGERSEIERQVGRSVAAPGHSQHQLGTTADLSSYELGFALRPSFAETQAGRWLAERAWEFGFVQPYTAAAEMRTGYIAEAWHYRWIGRLLAALLWQERYLTSPDPTVDDWLAAVEELMG